MQAFLEELAACALPEPGKVGPELRSRGRTSQHFPSHSAREGGDLQRNSDLDILHQVWVWGKWILLGPCYPPPP